MKGLLLLAAICLSVNAVSWEDVTNHENWKLVNDDVCGQSASSRIFGGKEPPLGAFPWIALLENKYNDVFCGGFLVTPDLVITAAHCTKQHRITSVHLGEHNRTGDPDCVGVHCADPVLKIPPKEVIAHRMYNRTNFKNDIAMVRLSRPVKFTDYVRPICLPSGPSFEEYPPGKMVEVAGWGLVNNVTFAMSNILQVVSVPVQSIDMCNDNLLPSWTIDDSQWCIGGEAGYDSCSGDSGGPVMTVSDVDGDPRYYILGIVSFGATECARAGDPAIYTKVPYFMDWILDNLVETTNSAVIISWRRKKRYSNKQN